MLDTVSSIIMLDSVSSLYLLVACSGIAVCLYFLYPIIYIHLYFKLEVYLSGMKLKYVQLDGLNICYGEKGKQRKGQASIVLIHGFTADKFMWVPLVKKLPPDTHIIAVDLPGHGDSDTPPEDHDISHLVTVKKMKALFDQLQFGDDAMHLVGMSMGGALAGLYAAGYPDDIHSLTMICPAMKTPVESTFWRQMREAIEAGEKELHLSCDLLFPTTAAQVQYMLDIVQYHKMWVPSQILHGVAEWRKRYYPFHSRLFKTIADPDMHDLLLSHVHKISAPTQVVWGENDQIIDPSGAELLRQSLPNCVQMDMIPRCGHSVSIDRPGAMTKAIVTFSQKVDSAR